MPSEFMVLNTVLASPGDVSREREIVAHAINQINADIGHSNKIHLHLIRWETDTHPGFHDAGPQGIIDGILQIETADLLIGLFWHRLGSPTADGMTGTEHEFHKAYECWRLNHRPQIMIYFNDANPPLKSLDPDQLARLRTFKQRFPKEGLWRSYKGSSQFRQVFESHLRKFLDAQIRQRQSQAVTSQGLQIERAISSRGLPIETDDFHRGQEVLKPTGNADDADRKKVWLEHQYLDDVIERLSLAREFSEIRAWLGNVLGPRFMKHLIENQNHAAEKFLAAECGLSSLDVQHLMRVSSEAMNHLSATDLNRGVKAMKPTRFGRG